MEIEVKRVEKVQAKTLRIYCKVRDDFTAHVLDEAGKELGGQDDGYVPGFMPDGGGDYLALNIDLESGQVTNWKQPSAEQLQQFIHQDEENRR